jgi:hypothetical protein
LYIDLSSEEIFEENYDKLLRNIYQVPLFKKPSLGKPPMHLFEDDVPNFQTSLVIRRMKSAAEKYPNRLKHIWSEFTEVFMASLQELQIERITDGDTIHELVVNKIDQSITLKNDYVAAIELLCLTDTIEVDQIIEFFEKIYIFTEWQGSGSYFDDQFDHFKFLITELYLYTATILYKYKMYSVLAQMLGAEYYVDSKSRYGNPVNFIRFRFYLKSLDQRNQELKLQRVSLHADLIFQRVSEKHKKDMLDTDLILYYVSKLKKQDDEWARIWFPITYIYHKKDNIKLINRLKSKKHFEDVKHLFNVETDTELKRRISDFKPDRGYNYIFDDGIPHILNFIKLDEICTMQ